MRFSLVVATAGRIKEVRALLQSLLAQSITSFEVIIVDQNDDDRLLPIIADFKDRFPIKHVRSAIKSCRHASNLGATHAVGDIIAFPDDDCEYTPTVLGHVNARFEQDPTLDFLTGGVLAPNGEKTQMGRWLTKNTRLDRFTIWTGLIEFNFFVKRALFDQIGGFDTTLGPPNRFGSCEGPDVCLRMMAKNAHGEFDTRLLVIHPNKNGAINTSRARAYGAGFGRVMRKNHLPVSFVLTYLIRSIGGGVRSLFRRNIVDAKYYLWTFIGRCEGYLASLSSK